MLIFCTLKNILITHGSHIKTSEPKSTVSSNFTVKSESHLFNVFNICANFSVSLIMIKCLQERTSSLRPSTDGFNQRHYTNSWMNNEEKGSLNYKNNYYESLFSARFSFLFCINFQMKNYHKSHDYLKRYTYNNIIILRISFFSFH